MDKTETPLLIAFVGIGPLLLVREIYSAPPVLIIGLVAIFFLIAVFLLGIVFVERIIKPLIRTLKKSITGKEYPPEAAPNYTRDYKHTVAPTRWEGEPTLPILQFATTYTGG